MGEPSYLKPLMKTTKPVYLWLKP